MAPPSRMDHIGSLLRPTELLEARSSLSSASQMYEISTDERVKAIERDSIDAVVRKQRELGIQPITSGEYCRHIFYGGFFETLQGMTPVPDLPIPGAFRTDFPTTTGLAKGGATTRAAVVCTAPIRWTESAYMSEWDSVRRTLPQNEWRRAKITLPSPSYQHIQLKPGTAYTSGSGYSNDEAYFADLGKAYTAEIQALYAAGVRQVQIDDPNLTYFCSAAFLRGCAADGTDPAALLDLYLAAHNHFLRERPGAAADLHLGLHLCRGNMAGSRHWVSGSYERIAEKLFARTAYDTYYLEFDDLDRTGGFECLRFLPRGKNVVLGLVSTKTVELEDVETLRERVLEAARFVADGQGVGLAEAMDALAISPQCGFSSSSLAGGTGMSEEKMWEKLGLVRDAARLIWDDATT